MDNKKPQIGDPEICVLDQPALNVDIGISRRDWFAAMAMQRAMDSYPFEPEEAADLAAKHADALIKELDKSK